MDHAPPAYAAVETEGGAEAPPPSYDPNAPGNSPQSQYPVISQPAANVTYVDQYGNPVAAPTVQPTAQPTVKYVDQYGNPVAAPTAVSAAQPAIKYVDQYGNPVNPPAAQQPAIKYVDQYGNPVAAPTGAQQPVIKYVDQYGNPVAAPVGTGGPAAPVASSFVTTSPAGMSYTTTTTASRSSRITSFVFGMLGFLMILIGFFCDNLARDTVYSGIDGTWTCGFTSLRFRCDDYYSSYYYWSSCSDTDTSWSDLCDAYQTLEDWGYSSSSPSPCATQSAAALTLVCQILALLFCLIGFVYAQPWSNVKPCMCKNCGRSCLFASLVFSVMALILWYAVADYCIGDNPASSSYSWYSYDDFSVGATIVLHIIGMIFNFIAALLARAPPADDSQPQQPQQAAAVNAGYPGAVR